VQPITCLVASGNRIVSGSVSGAIYMWVGRNCAKGIKAHMVRTRIPPRVLLQKIRHLKNRTLVQGCVNALHACKTALISGGKDMRVRIWTLGLEPGRPQCLGNRMTEGVYTADDPWPSAGPTFNMAAFGTLPMIRSVAMSADALRLLIGTKGSEIYEISSADGSVKLLSWPARPDLACILRPCAVPGQVGHAWWPHHDRAQHLCAVGAGRTPNQERVRNGWR
jgi:hypothetical protein